MKDAPIPISTVVLVGGFAASDWLFSNLQTQLAIRGLSVCRPDGHINKAVADGEISFYLDHFVSVRVAKFSYGTECCVNFRATKTKHQDRRETSFMRPSGHEAIPGYYSEILAKGTCVSEEKEFAHSYNIQASSRLNYDLIHAEEEIMSYRGAGPVPRWIDEDPLAFPVMCTVSADLSKLCKTLKPQRSPTGEKYFVSNYDIVLLFGLTELKAQIRWKEKDGEKRCPAVVVYEGDSDMSSDESDEDDDSE